MTREKIIDQAKSWIGFNEKDGSHKKIIDVYNSNKPLARGYKVKYSDAWCAVFVSACAIKISATDILPTECGCEEMINLFKKIGSWNEDDSYLPIKGDIIFYDWQDSGKGDNKGYSDHVGIVEEVKGKTITVIEGNYSDSVKRRKIKVGDRYIRGYGVPKYDIQPISPDIEEVNAKNYADEFDRFLAGTYTVTASSLNMRNGAGTKNSVMVVMPKGLKIKNYGYYSYDSNGSMWLYVEGKIGNKKYTGFCMKKYLSK